MKRNYNEPTLEWIRLLEDDVIRTSLEQDTNEVETDEQGNPWTPWV